jgi:hypothetical protein
VIKRIRRRGPFGRAACRYRLAAVAVVGPTVVDGRFVAEPERRFNGEFCPPLIVVHSTNPEQSPATVRTKPAPIVAEK